MYISRYPIAAKVMSSNVYKDMSVANRREISLLNTDWICEEGLLVILVECNPYKGTGTPPCAV